MKFTSVIVFLCGAGAGTALGDGPAKFEPLPRKISSFGACTSDGWLYVYGGHTGRTHTYSTATTTGKFFRAKLTGGKWEELPAGPALQGLALVAHKGKIYRVGGMQPRNKPGEKADTQSLASFACYDPAARKWQDLADLPEPRSSHDAVVIGDRLYVAGGWRMGGAGKPTAWHKTALEIDLGDTAAAKWKSIEQPFKRRALAVAALGGKVVVVGGLTVKGTSKGMDIYDPATGKWTTGPELPGEGTGFSPAAGVLGKDLYAVTNDGKIHRLDEAGKKWAPAGELAVARHVNRVVVGGDGALVVLGGSAAKGDSRALEVIKPMP